jgi:hypothetical protein
MAAATLSPGCVTHTLPSNNYLSEDELIALMENPREWDGRTVTVRIYPYDLGSDGTWSDSTYIVCFEPCDESYADRSPFIVYTARDRFRGYRGDRAAVITARYGSTCFYAHSYACPDLYFGQFTEILSQ